MQAGGEPEIFQTESTRRFSSLKETKLISCIPRLTLNANGTTAYLNRGYKTKKHLFAIWAALLIHKLSAATVVIEQAPGYLMMQHFLKRAGYTVEARVLDPRDYGEITGRRRSVIVAHSGSNFQWPQASPATHTFADIRDDESTTIGRDD